jgi:SAM-dependent methyltransferase
VREIPSEVRAYYEQGREVDRLAGTAEGAGPLELARTQELILRELGPGPLDVLDVGGGPGVYAAWFAGLGHRVHLVDPVPLHVQQAREVDPRVTAEVGDARALPRSDASADVVLLMGPLYHLTERDDRLLALREARRALRDGGLLVVAAISRYAALLDLLLRLDVLHEPDVLPVAERAARTGILADSRERLFTMAYFHRAGELADEISEARFVDVRVLPVEGPGGFLPDFAERWADPARREAIMAAARIIEDDPELVGLGGHLLAIARPAPTDQP